MTIQDSETLTIHEEYSKELESILETKAIGSTNFVSSILDHSTLSTDEKSQVKEVLQIALNESIFSYEINADKLVKELNLKVGKKEKIIEID
ncbi:MAG: hypothetical protein HRU19_17050 [Pseudobacteriovorax sp.]|nr:hypothetical protein [Pseudobacteriovorax sp.]